MTTDPTPPTAVTARDALVAKVTSDWDADPYGEYEAARSRLIADLDNLIALAAAEAPGRVAALEAALRAIVSELERFWEHGEDCPVWATDDVTDEPMYPGDIPARHEACDCGIAVLLGKADAALAAPASPAGVSGEVCGYAPIRCHLPAGHDGDHHDGEGGWTSDGTPITHPAPAPTPSEPVARCVGEHDWETRHPGDLAVCRRCWTVESDATPATRDE